MFICRESKFNPNPIRTEIGSTRPASGHDIHPARRPPAFRRIEPSQTNKTPSHVDVGGFQARLSPCRNRLLATRV